MPYRTISRVFFTTWLLSVALEATVSCEKHDQEYGGGKQQAYNEGDKHAGHENRHVNNSHPYDSDRHHRDYYDEPDRKIHSGDDYHYEQPEAGLQRLPENEMHDRRAAYDSRPLYDHRAVYERRPVYHDPLYYAPPASYRNIYNNPESRRSYDDHYRSPQPYIDDYNRSYPGQQYPGVTHSPRVGLLRSPSGASGFLEKKLNRSLNRGLHHLRDAKHQLSPETRNTIRNLKNELLHEDPAHKGKRLSKRVDSLVRRGNLFAKVL